MALFIIERTFAEAIAEESAEASAEIEAVNAELGLDWVQSFLSLDRTRTYCLYEAPNAEALREHAERLGIPADSILEVSKAL